MMRRFHIALLFPLLLVLSQQAAVSHELSHFHGGSDVATWTQTNPAADSTCRLCLAFSQVSNPANASVHVPAGPLTALQLSPQPSYSILAAGVPTPRSRGPPARS